MKKTSIILLFIIIILCAFCVGHSIGYKNYSGYTVYYDAESNKGFVYINNDSSSAIIVTYPSSDQAFTYSKKGQIPLSYARIKSIILDEDSGVFDSIVAKITPIE
jgi:hypothetical protein